MDTKRRKLSGKSRRGRPPKHGGYSELTKGAPPENRIHIKRYLTAVRANLIADLGPTEEDLTTAKLILIDRVISKLWIVRCIEEHIRENSVLEGDTD